MWPLLSRTKFWSLDSFLSTSKASFGNSFFMIESSFVHMVSSPSGNPKCPIQAFCVLFSAGLGNWNRSGGTTSLRLIWRKLMWLVCRTLCGCPCLRYLTPISTLPRSAGACFRRLLDGRFVSHLTEIASLFTRNESSASLSKASPSGSHFSCTFTIMLASIMFDDLVSL